MNNRLTLLVATLALVACGTNNQAVVEAPPSLTEQAVTIDSMLSIGETKVGDTIVVRGYVRHTCKMSGRKCFISDAERTQQIRVMAGGEIGGFNKELIGSELAIKGILRENRTSREALLEALAQWEELKAQGEEASAHSCESMLNNLAAKMQIMEESGKGYYSEFYLDGLDFDEIVK